MAESSEPPVVATAENGLRELRWRVHASGDQASNRWQLVAVPLFSTDDPLQAKVRWSGAAASELVEDSAELAVQLEPGGRWERAYATSASDLEAVAGRPEAELRRWILRHTDHRHRRTAFAYSVVANASRLVDSPPSDVLKLQESLERHGWDISMGVPAAGEADAIQGGAREKLRVCAFADPSRFRMAEGMLLAEWARESGRWRLRDMEARLIWRERIESPMRRSGIYPGASTPVKRLSRLMKLARWDEQDFCKWVISRHVRRIEKS